MHCTVFNIHSILFYMSLKNCNGNAANVSNTKLYIACHYFAGAHSKRLANATLAGSRKQAFSHFPAVAFRSDDICTSHSSPPASAIVPAVWPLQLSVASEFSPNGAAFSCCVWWVEIKKKKKETLRGRPLSGGTKFTGGTFETLQRRQRRQPSSSLGSHEKTFFHFLRPLGLLSLE